MSPRINNYLDILTTLALCWSVVLAALMFVDLGKPPEGTFGTQQDNREHSARAAIFLGLLCAPIVFSAISWPFYLRQKRAGAKVFGGLRFVFIASALWTSLVFSALNNL